MTKPVPLKAEITPVWNMGCCDLTSIGTRENPMVRIQTEMRSLIPRVFTNAVGEINFLLSISILLKVNKLRLK